MCHLGGLPAVDSPGTGKQEILRSACLCKFQGVTRAFDNRIQHLEWVLCIESGTAFGGGMDQVAEFTFRKIKGTDIALYNGNRVVSSKMRNFRPKQIRGAGEDHGLAVQVQTISCPKKTFQQPTSEESRAAGNKDTFSTQFIPQFVGMFQNMIKIRGESICHSLRGGLAK